jgi:hypothetical protein
MNSKRKEELKLFLKDYNKKKDNTEINEVYNDIEKKWTEDLIDYTKIIDLTQLKVGNFIKYINLDLSQIKYGILVKLVYFKDNITIKYIYLKNTIKKNNNVWRIKPSKNYIYQKKNKNRSQLSKLIDEFLLKINNKK